MSETAFLILVLACFAVFMAVLAWAQVTTPARGQDHGKQPAGGQ